MPIQGLEKVIQFPGPQRRPYGLLLDVATQLTDAQLSQDGINRVGAGVTFVPWGCDPLRRGNVDCDTDWLLSKADEQGEETSEPYEDGKPAEPYPDTDSQRPFKIVDSLKCNAFSMIPEEMDDRLRVRMRELVSASFAAELITGAASGGNSLSAAAQVVNAPFSAFPDLLGPAAALERFLADTLNGAWGIIHMPVELIAAAKYADWIYHDGEYLRTCTGHYVVADAGYDGASGPPEENGGAGPGEYWVYATGPVYYHLTDTMLLGDNPNQTFDIEFNLRRRIAEAVGLVTFDACSVGATLVSLAGFGG